MAKGAKGKAMSGSPFQGCYIQVENTEAQGNEARVSRKTQLQAGLALLQALINQPAIALPPLHCISVPQTQMAFQKNKTKLKATCPSASWIQEVKGS